MRVSIFTHKERIEDMKAMLSGITDASGVPEHEYKFYETYDDFVGGIPRDGCQSIIVARDGANGMESARAAKILKHRTPLVWFSNDNEFGPESYRVGCAYFFAGTLTTESFSKAFSFCLKALNAKNDD